MARVIAAVRATALDRRSLLLAAACIMTASRSLAAHPGLSIGAIRWDPWYEPTEGGERSVMERTLGPQAFRGRAPSCAAANNSGNITLKGCATQARIDAEITAAQQAGIDYWAYCWYGATNRMQEAWRLHQSSNIRREMNWCLLFSSYERFQADVGSLSTLAELRAYLSQDNYQHVASPAGYRPLVYLLDNGKDSTRIAQAVSAFRSACAASGLGSPYVVLLGSKPSTQAGSAAAAGADAVGTYAFSPSANRSSYRTLAEAVQAHWAATAATKQPMVPTAMTGWDRRPRIEHPVPWEVSMPPASSRAENYYRSGSPIEIAAHIAAMLAWIRSNPAACEARTGLIYSWDEHDEGGSTLSPSISQGDTILAAIRHVL